MRIIKIEEPNVKDTAQPVEPVKLELTQNDDVNKLIKAILSKKSKGYEERVMDIIRGSKRMRERFGKKPFDMYSFIVGVIWCEERPSKETVFRAIDTYCGHDRDLFTNADVALVWDSITNERF